MQQKFCGGKQLYDVVKTVKLTECQQKPVLNQIHPGVAYNATSKLWNRYIVTRAILCGNVQNNEFILLAIQQEGQIRVGQHQAKRVVVQTRQTFVLVNVSQASSGSIHLPSQRTTITNLRYNFADAAQNQQHGQHQQWQQQQQQQQQQGDYQSNDYSQEGEYNSRRSHPRFQMSDSGNDYSSNDLQNQNKFPFPSLREAPIGTFCDGQLSQQEMARQVEQLIKQCASDVTQSNSRDKKLADTKILRKLMFSTFIVRKLSYETIQQILQSLGSPRSSPANQAAVSLYYDVVAEAGTPPAISFVIQQIQNEELKGEKAVLVTMTIGRSIRHPTRELLKKLTQFAKFCQGKEQLRVPSLLTVSKIYFKACVDKKTMKNVFSAQLYPQWCDAAFVAQEYLPYLQDLLKQYHSQQNKFMQHAVLRAMGRTGSRDVYPELKQIIENQQYDVATRVHAIWALIPTLRRGSLPVTSDNSQVHQLVKDQIVPFLVRWATKSDAKGPVKLAAAAALMVPAIPGSNHLQLLAKSTHQDSNQQYCRFVYSSLQSLAAQKKPVNRALQHVVLHAKQALPEAKQVIPDILDSRNVFANVASQKNGWGLLFHYAQFSAANNNDMPYRYIGQLLQNVGQYGPYVKLAEVFADFYNYQNVEGSEGAFGYNILGAANMIKIERNPQEQLEQYLTELVRSAISDNKDFSLQRFAIPVEHVKEVPSVMGLPLTYRMYTPVMLSVRGNIDRVQNQHQADLYIAIAMKHTTSITVKVPLMQREFKAAVSMRMHSELPLRAVIRQGEHGQHELAITPTHLDASGSPTGEIQVMNAQVLPFTSEVKSTFPEVAQVQSYDRKIIRNSNRQHSSRQFGRSLGFVLKVESQYDTPKGQRSLSSSPRKLLQHFGLSSKFAEMIVTYDCQQSQANTLIFTAALGRTNGRSDINNNVGSSSSEEQWSHTSNSGSNQLTAALAVAAVKTYLQPIEKKSQQQQVWNFQQPWARTAIIQAQTDKHSQALLVLAQGSEAVRIAKQLPTENSQMKAVQERVVAPQNSRDQNSEGCVVLNANFDKQGSYQRNSNWQGNFRTTLNYGQQCQRDRQDTIMAHGKLQLQHQGQYQAEATVQYNNIPYSFQQIAQQAEQQLRRTASNVTKQNGSPLQQSSSQCHGCRAIRFQVESQGKRSNLQIQKSNGQQLQMSIPNVFHSVVGQQNHE
jgi:hypothetical protein